MNGTLQQSGLRNRLDHGAFLALVVACLLAGAVYAESPTPFTPIPVTHRDTPVTFALEGQDPLGRPLRARIIYTTVRGRLYQVNEDGSRGALIEDLPETTWVTNSQRLVLYEPPAGAYSTRDDNIFETLVYQLAAEQDGQLYLSFLYELAIKVVYVPYAPVASAQTLVGVSDDPFTEIFLNPTHDFEGPLTFRFTRLPTWGAIYFDSFSPVPIDAETEYSRPSYVYRPRVELPCMGYIDSFSWYAVYRYGGQEYTSNEVTARIEIARRNCPGVADDLPDLTTNGEPVDVELRARSYAGADRIAYFLEMLPENGRLSFHDIFIENPVWIGLPGPTITLQYTPNAGYQSGDTPDTFQFLAHDGVAPALRRGRVRVWVSSQAPPRPYIAAINPAVVAPASPAFDLVVSGSGFKPESRVRWNGADLNTVAQSPTEIVAQVPAGLVETAGAAEITVFTPPLVLTDPDRQVGGGPSHPKFLHVTQAAITASTNGQKAVWLRSDPETIWASVTGEAVLGLARFGSDPTSQAAFQGASNLFFDLRLGSGHSGGSMGVYVCDPNGGDALYWWSGTAWAPVSHQGFQNVEGCVFAFFHDSSTPSLAQLTGTIFGVGMAGALDTTPPVITASVTGTHGNNHWYVGNVTVSWSVADPESAITVSSGCDTVQVTQDTNGTTYTCRATSAGGEAVESVTIARDTTPPAIQIVSPAATVYTLNQQVAANYVCSDAGGLASCAGPVASGDAVHTGAVGNVDSTVAAADLAGHTASRTVSYKVAYNVCLLYDPTRAARSGSTLPIRIQLCDATGANYSSSGVTVTALGVRKISDAAGGELLPAETRTPDANFRFDAALSGYVFNLSTSGLTVGTYALAFTAGGDPTTHEAIFVVK